MSKIFTKGKAVQLSPNFKTTEFDCKGRDCCDCTPIDEILIVILQNIRNHYGKPVYVNCGYRCPKHNSETKGASRTSKHMSGMAADIAIKEIHPVSIARYVETIQGFAGHIGCYTWDDVGKGFVHIDVRGINSRGIYTEDNIHYDKVDSFNPYIKAGTSGRIVIVVQRRLKSVGLYSGEIDGQAGRKTVAAFAEWNTRHGRDNNTVWGPLCWGESF